MDTRFWGPSGWQLFHLVAFTAKHPDDVLNQMKDVLPCKFCRASTTKFVHDHPLRGDPAKWVYEIHKMVNHKLRTQCKDDPDVVNPGEDPSFESVKQHYEGLRPNAIPGSDFLFAVAGNYPVKPEPEDMSRQREFVHALAKVYPFDELNACFQQYLQERRLTLESRSSYMHWMYGLIKALAAKTHSRIPTYRGYAHQIAYFRSGCTKKTYHGKTCRKTSKGVTKDRDRAKTFRVAHSRLLR